MYQDGILCIFSSIDTTIAQRNALKSTNFGVASSLFPVAISLFPACNLFIPRLQSPLGVEIAYCDTGAELFNLKLSSCKVFTHKGSFRELNVFKSGNFYGACKSAERPCFEPEFIGMI